MYRRTRCSSKYAVRISTKERLDVTGKEVLRHVAGNDFLIGGKRVDYDSEPDAGTKKRIEVALYGVLPIQELL